jgi:O-antigen/teichoic acid export membrane protein
MQRDRGGAILQRETSLMLLRPSLSRLSIASVSPICFFGLRFFRTIVLSHLLLPNEVGSAVALMSILSGCEMVLDVGLDRFVIVNDGAHRAQAAAVARQITIVRALVLAAILITFAPELGAVFGAKGLSGSVGWLALVPIIYSFRNWRLVQIQQEYRYGPEAVVTVCGQAAALVAIVPAVELLHDHRAIVVSLISEAAVSTLLSNVLVSRERVTAIDPAMRQRALAFCLPLVVNGVSLMAFKQLDQVVVANLFDLPTLALYSLSLNLALTPTSPLQAICQKLALPFLVRTRGDPGRLHAASALIIAGTNVLAALYAIPLGVLLAKLVPVLYGARYHATEAFCGFAMLVAFLRFCRAGPTIILLHRGSTAQLTLSTLAAASGTLIGLLLGLWFRRLEGIVAGLAIGDLLSLSVLFCLMVRQVSLSVLLKRAGSLMIIVGLVATVICASSDMSAKGRLVLLLGGTFAVAVEGIVVYRQFLHPLVPVFERKRHWVQSFRNICGGRGRPGRHCADADT